MPISRAVLSQEEEDALLRHISKHKIYPFRYRINKTINGTNFNVADGSIGKYFTLTWTPGVQLGAVVIAPSFIITPNTQFGTYAVFVSYNNTLTLADNGSPSSPDSEGDIIYQLWANGGAINDLQVVFPLNWYLESQKSLYIHVWADITTVNAGTAAIAGGIMLGTLITGKK